MALIIPPGYAQVVLNWTGARFESGAGATVFGWGETLGNDPVSLNDFAVHVENSWKTYVLPLQDGDLTFASVEVIGNSDTAFNPVGVNGGTNFASVPPNVACLVRKNVNGRGRRRQGRMFLPGILAAGVVNDAGIIDSGAVSSINSALNTWLDNLTTLSSCPMVILQNSEGLSPPVSPPPVVTSLSVQSRVASQRKRLRR